MKDLNLNSFEEHIAVCIESKKKLTHLINEACQLILKALINGNKIILFGNGGSAADCQHIAAEFTGRFVKERRPLSAIALTTDTSALTAIGNDYGFDKIFVRQIEALAIPGDILIGISTSGNSLNVINALIKGKELGCVSIALTGKDGGVISSYSDVNLIVPSSVTARIQEVHILIGHMFCEFVDNRIS